MKLLSKTLEKSTYAILRGNTNLDSHDEKLYAPNLLRGTLLSCDIQMSQLRKCENEPSTALRAAFDRACREKDERFKLMSIVIRDGRLFLGFADTHAMVGNKYLGETLEFRTFGEPFRVITQRNPMGAPYEYLVLFHDESGGPQANGEAVIAEISKTKNWRAAKKKVISRGDDGRFFVREHTESWLGVLRRGFCL